MGTGVRVLRLRKSAAVAPIRLHQDVYAFVAIIEVLSIWGPAKEKGGILKNSFCIAAHRAGYPQFTVCLKGDLLPIWRKRGPIIDNVEYGFVQSGGCAGFHIDYLEVAEG